MQYGDYGSHRYRSRRYDGHYWSEEVRVSTETFPFRDRITYCYGNQLLNFGGFTMAKFVEVLKTMKPTVTYLLVVWRVRTRGSLGEIK